jgi:pimeloyl-ACP methyl ester carboxylesterase
MTTTYIVGPNGDLFVEERGVGGTPVLFVHGNGGSSKVWHAQLEHLERSRRALAVDLHGFGHSDVPGVAAYSVESFAADLEAVTTASGIDRLVLVGHSLGGAVVARFAVAHRQWVAGVVYVDCVGDTRMPARVAASMGEELRSRAEPDHAIEWFRRLLADARDDTRTLVLDQLADASREAVVGAFLALTRVDPSRWVAEFSGPALHVFVPRFNHGATSLGELVPTVPSISMTGVSHWPMIDKPEVFNHHLDQFLKRVDSAASATPRPI